MIQWSVLVKGKFQHQAIIILAQGILWKDLIRWLEINRYSLKSCRVGIQFLS